jgi:hypothetical protein
MVRTVTAIVGLVSCLSMSACTDGDVAAAPTTTSPSSTSAAQTTPTTSAPTSPPTQEPQPPELPALAKEKSPAGAKAFVKYYMGIVNYSWHVGSGSLARRYSTPECVACRGIASSIDEMSRAGGFYRGGDWAADSPVLIPSEPLDTPIVHTALKQSAGEWKRSADDRLRRIPPSRSYVDVHLTREGALWKVTSMVFA